MVTLEYKGFKGTIEYSNDDKLYFGRVLKSNDLLSYEGESIELLKKDFEELIDQYVLA